MKERYTLATVLLFPLFANAQLSITDSLTTGTIATLLEGYNVTVSNVAVNCAPQAMGYFTGSSELAITEGLVLTNGSADLVSGPNDQGAAGLYLGTAGDSDLDFAVGGPTYDACGLEFDCVPMGDTLLFNFSFGSEEYMEFAGSAFNDAFAIYLTGPGFDIPTNVAALPGGTTVSINNVNELVNPTYYYNNEVPAGQYVQYDGFTTNLTVFAVVQPGETYHFKVVVADVADGIFDSGVFLEAFSFRSPLLTTAFGEVERMDMRIIPQGDDWTVQVPSALAKGRELLVYNATGSVVGRKRITGTRTALDMGDLGMGVYILQVHGSPLKPLRFVKDK